jgi:2-dehydropantoate 2-reductase
MGATLTIEYPDGTEISRSDFQTELGRTPFRSHGRVTDAPTLIKQTLKPHWDTPSEYEEFDPKLAPDHANKELISTLILAQRPQHVVPTLLGIKHRLTAQSTIFVVTTGLGAVEEIYETVFPDVEARPSIVLGISTHNIHRLPATRDPHFMSREQSYFRVLRWKQLGALFVSALPRWKNRRDPEAFKTFDDRDGDGLSPTTRYLLRTLRRTPILVPTFMKPIEFFLLQLETVAVQVVLESMSMLTDSRYSHLLYNWRYTVAMRMIAHEVSIVIRALPEIQGYPNLEERFSPSRIVRLVYEECREKKNKVSPGVFEMRAGSKTAEGYTSKYIVERGEELGLRPVINYFVSHLVAGKSLMVRHEAEEEMELAEEYPPEMGIPKYR